jgi:2-desacetyl-2-hydroxyethyl bacteriochlorophyllide A dehydrogenase
MKAGVFTGIGRIELADAPEPEVAPGGIVVAVRTCGICGSDLHGFSAGLYTEPGQIMGHEFAGDVVEVGPEVTGIAVGDRVSAMPMMACGQCEACQAGEIQRCLTGFSPGIGVGGGPGAFAERVHVPDARRGETVFTLPAGFSYDDGALLEPLAVALHAVRRSGVEASDVVVVAGLGPIGQLVGRVLLARGVRTVIGVELSPERRARAQLAGMVAADGANGLRAAVASVLGDQPRIDAVIETAGAPSLPQQAVELVVRGGSVTIVALYERAAPLDVAAFAVSEVTVRATLAYQSRDFAEAIELIGNGSVRASEIVTGHARLSELQGAFEGLVAGGDAIKTLIDPGPA